MEHDDKHPEIFLGFHAFPIMFREFRSQMMGFAFHGK